MGKLFAFLLVLLAIYLFRRALAKPSAPPPDQRAAAPGAQAERMVACAHCGLHVPESEAVEGAGQLFCCPAHRQAHSAGK